MGKLKTIEFDLSVYKILLQFHGKKEPLVIHFDTPSRRFYFSIIALIINEMKKQGKTGFIHIHKHQNILELLDKSLSGKHASKHVEGIWTKINMAWRHRLPDLETAALFKVIDRDLIPPYEKGGKYRYECSDVECDIWANLFGYDENNKWRFKFAIDSASISLSDVSVKLGDLRDNLAWQEFVKSFSIQPKDVSREERAVPKWWKKAVFPLVAVSIVGFAALAIYNFYVRPVPPTTELELPDKPSIAVMPFKNISQDPNQEYFSDGITEEIISALGSVPKLFVIARNSTFTYKDKPVKVQQVSEELGVKYVLEGSVRKAGDKIRITAQLIDALNGNHLWAERYDQNLNDIFAVQDEITKNIVTAMQVKLTEGEQARATAKGTDNLEAYLKCLQANELIGRLNPESNALGRQLAEEAIALDPEYAWAYCTLAKTHTAEVWFGMSRSPKVSIEKAIKLAQKAIALDNSLAEAHAQLGWLFSMTRQHDKAIAEGEMAVTLNPNSADSHMRYGKILTFAGKYEESIPELKMAIRINPIPPNIYLYSLGISYCWTGQYDEAITWCEKAVRREPNSMFARLFMAMIYSLSGRDEEARAEASEVLRIQPKFSLDNFAKTATFKNQEDIERCISALRKAGLK
jgi:adenylate cyclase